MFKLYKNKKTNHPSVSIRRKDHNYWWNMPITHSKPSKDASLEIDDPHPNNKRGGKSYIRCYVRKDKKRIKGHRYREYVLSAHSEMIIKIYLKIKYKKR